LKGDDRNFHADTELSHEKP